MGGLETVRGSKCGKALGSYRSRWQCRQELPTCSHQECMMMYRATQKNALPNLTVIRQVRKWLARGPTIFRNPKHDSLLSGRQWMDELWSGNDNRFFEQFRMRKEAFARLICLIRDRYGFQMFQKVSIDESAAMFVMIIGHALTFPIICERFQHSGQTVHNHLHEDLVAICRMGGELIRPTENVSEIAIAHMKGDGRYWPHFKDCVGAIDGTHINLRIATDPYSYRWFNQKGEASTNILVACDFNLAITYAKVGLEGSMHDARILREALQYKQKVFPTPPSGKYYVADAGYANSNGFLTPYKKVRYHLEHFRQQPLLRTGKEKFNFLHSSLRNAIERTFGVCKERWKILKNMTKFDLPIQINIIWACFALHNYLRRYEIDDLTLLGVDETTSNFDSGGDHSTGEFYSESGRDSLLMNDVRESIRESICNHS